MGSHAPSVSDPAGEAAPSGAAVGADAFVSYARSDQEFVRRLEAALRERGKDVWVDWADIPATADWRAKIHAGIDAAHAFLAVLSPDLVTSPICREELEHATGSNKRLVPVLRREVDRSSTPEELLVPNWIFFRESDDFEQSLDRLVDALETDLNWLDDHARLTVRAVEWDREQRDASFLLRGRDLSEAEAWLAQQASHREQATPLQTEFIVASRRGAARRQRVAFTGVVVALAVSLVLGIVALLQRNDAIEQSNVSRSRELAATAIAQLPTDPRVSLLLAREAVRVRETTQAEDALRRSLRESHLRLIIATAKAPAYVPSGAEFSPDGTRILTVGASLARSWDARTGILLRRFRVRGSHMTSAHFDTNGRHVVTTDAEGAARVWDAETAKRIAILRGHRDRFTDAVFSRDGTRVLTAGEGRAGLFDARSGRRIAVLPCKSHVNRAIFSRDGRIVVTVSEDGYLRIWNGHTGSLVRAIQTRDGSPATSAALTPSGKLVASATWLHARIWSVETGKLVATLRGHEQGGSDVLIFSVAFSPDGLLAATAGADGTVRLWKAPDWSAAATLRGHSGDVKDASFSADGTRILSRGADGNVRVWDAVTGESIAVLSVPQGWNGTADLARDGNRIVTASEDGVRLWTASGLSLLRSFPSRSDRVKSLVLSPDARTVAAVSDSPPIELWNVHTGERVARIDAGELVRKLAVVDPRALGAAFALSPDGTRIAANDALGVAVTDLETGRRIHLRSSLPNLFGGPAFSEDGAVVYAYTVRTQVEADDFAVTAERDGIWNAETGEIVSVLDATAPGDARFSEDARRVLTYNDGKLLVTAAGPSMRVYRCEECGTLDDVRRFADERIERTVTPVDRVAFRRIASGR